MRRKATIVTLVIVVSVLLQVESACVHDHFASNATYHYYNDLGEGHSGHPGKDGRLLQTVASHSGSIRIFTDYTFMAFGGQTEKNQIKRVLNISANYFYNIMKVDRLSRLLYPSDTSLQCNILTVPMAYVTTGVVGDLGILVANENSTTQYIAKSTACALLKSNNRPIWGVMIWNINYLQYDQVGFQKIVYVAIHEIIHILGYSSAMYDKYPLGNPYRTDGATQYLTSPAILQEVTSYFGCANPKGLILQDQDGTLIPSHTQKKVFGNEVMIASGKKGAYFSRTTVALLNSMGWYNVTFDYAQPAIWGKGRGCNFLNIDNCTSPEFCTGSDFGCDWDVTAMGRCDVDPFAGSCKLFNYFTNTICIDQNYEIKNLNSNLQALQRGGHNSKCFASNFRKTGLQPSTLNNRCYVTVCSVSKNFLYILIGQNVMVCTQNNLGQDIQAPSGLDGTLRCPTSFSNYCDIKKTCTYHCNKNGACINGQCLCTGSTTLTSTCLDVGLSTVQVENTGGLINALRLQGDLLILENTKSYKSKKYNDALERVAKSLSQGEFVTKEVLRINTVAQKGTYFDPEFGEIVLCEKKFGCLECTRFGCINCPGGSVKSQGRCLLPRRL